MPTIARVIAVLAALLLAFAAGVFLFLRSPASSDAIYRTATAVGLNAAPPERHVLPEGFQGWAVVHFGVEGAPPLREEDGVLIIEYPASGRLDTSTAAPEAEGLLQRGYYRRTPDGLMPLSRATEIWGEFRHVALPDGAELLPDPAAIGNAADLGSDPAAGNTEARLSSGFFVGTLAEFRATPWPEEHREPLNSYQ